MSIARMRRTLTVREFDRWRRYWAIEPWGTWRANMHAAIIAQAVLQPHVKRGSKIALDDFMLMPPDERAAKRTAEGNAALIGALRAMAQATGKRKKIVRKRKA